MPGPANALNITESGVVTFDGVSVFKGRTIIGGAGITVTNGNGISANPTISLTGGGAAIESITGNTGGAEVPSAGNFNFLTANTTVKFAGTAATETLDFGLGNLVLGSSLPALAGGANTTGLGFSVLSSLTSGVQCTAMGYQAMSDHTTGVSTTGIGYWALKGSNGDGNVAVGATTLNNCSGSANVAIGYLSMGQGTGTYNSNTAVGNAALNKLTTAIANNGIGLTCLNALTSGQKNQAIGVDALFQIVSGTDNIAIGHAAGFNNTTSDSSNIYLNNLGGAGENNTTRIGTQGTGAGQQNACFIAGITGVTVANQALTTLNTSTGQLGQITSGPVVTAGAMINTAQPCFNAYVGTTVANVTGDGTAYTVIFNTEINDQASNYNNATGIFTAPVTGNYLFNATVVLSGIILQTASLINFNGSAYGIVPFEVGQTNAFSNNVGTATAIVKMTAGDTMKVDVYSFGSTKTVSVTGGAPATGLTLTSTFSGVLLC